MGEIVQRKVCAKHSTAASLTLAVPIATLAFLFIRLKASPMGLTFAGAARLEGTAEGGIVGFI